MSSEALRQFYSKPSVMQTRFILKQETNNSSAQFPVDQLERYLRLHQLLGLLFTPNLTHKNAVQNIELLEYFRGSTSYIFPVLWTINN